MSTSQSPTSLLFQWQYDLSQYQDIVAGIPSASSPAEVQSYASEIKNLLSEMTSLKDQLFSLTGSNAISTAEQNSIESSLSTISTFLSTYSAASTVSENFKTASVAYSSGDYATTLTDLITTWESLQTNSKTLGTSAVSQYTSLIQQSFSNVFIKYYQSQVQNAQAAIAQYDCPAVVQILESMLNIINQSLSSGVAVSLNPAMNQLITVINNQINYLNDNPSECNQSGGYTQDSNPASASNQYTGILQEAVSSGSPVGYITEVVSWLMRQGDVSQAQTLLSDAYPIFRQEGQSNLYNQLMGVI